MRFGVNGGVNYSEIKGMEFTNVNYSGKTAFTAGLSFEYYINTNFSLKADPSFERKSNKAKNHFSMGSDPSLPFQPHTMKIWNNLDFITLPVLFKYNFGKQKSIFVNAGPYIGYLLNATHHIDTNHDPDNELTGTSDITDIFDRFDAGFTVGAGKAFKLKNGNAISIELRNTIGIKDINRYEWFYGKSFTTQSISLITGWSFEL